MIAKLVGRFFILFGVALVIGVVVFFALPTLLIASSQTPKADVIVDYSIDSRTKAESYIAWLYRENVARKVVTASSQMSYETYPADFARDHLIELGVKREDVSALRLPILDCRAAMLAETAKFLKTNGWKNALIICQPEDSRNTGILASRIFGKEGIEVAVGYAPEDGDDIRVDWWKTHWKVQRFVDEAMNTSLDLLYAECR